MTAPTRTLAPLLSVSTLTRPMVGTYDRASGKWRVKLVPPQPIQTKTEGRK